MQKWLLVDVEMFVEVNSGGDLDVVFEHTVHFGETMMVGSK